jgi:hypothetical protein
VLDHLFDVEELIVVPTNLALLRVNDLVLGRAAPVIPVDPQELVARWCA